MPLLLPLEYAIRMAIEKAVRQNALEQDMLWHEMIFLVKTPFLEEIHALGPNFEKIKVFKAKKGHFQGILKLKKG